MTGLFLCGAGGKMGRQVADLVAKTDDMRIVGGTDIMAAKLDLGYPVYADFADVPADCAIDVVVDFSRPGALGGLLRFCKERNLPVIVATTGHSEEDRDRMEDASHDIPVFKSANMSLGINLMMQLLRNAAAFLYNDYDIEIVERHHNTKADAPSGTALVLAEAINEAFSGKKDYIFGRHGKNERRSPKEIGIHAVRGGTVAGDHSVMFLGEDEELCINHSASSRRVFAVGALQAARFMAGKEPGFYDMEDIILEKSSVTNIRVERDIALLSARDIPFGAKAVSEIFLAIAEKNINIDMISQNTNSRQLVDVSLTLPDADKSKALGAVQALGYACDADEGVVKVTVEGLGMERQAGVAARLFALFAEKDIPLHIITTSETKIAVCIDKGKEKRAVLAMKEAFGI